jgi:hypothetical protein
MNKEEIVKLLMWLGDCYNMDNRESADKCADEYISENEPKSLNIDLVSGFIPVKDHTPTKEDEGDSFICKAQVIGVPNLFHYEVCQWFNPMIDGCKAIADHEKSHFLTSDSMYEVVGWMRINDR